MRDGDLIFDPVRTAHKGLRAYEWPVQKRVYIPFHFIPPRPIRRAGDGYATEPGSEFALMVLREACAEEPGLLRLCRIGIALHTFADTWAHQGFSGRHHEENDVEAIHHFENGEWNHLFLQNMFLDALPQIGHAEAGTFPDQPYLTWKHKTATSEGYVNRNNPEEFLKAAQAIYEKLCNCSAGSGGPPSDDWDSTKTATKQILETPEESCDARCGLWRERFQPLFGDYPLDYDKLAWGNAAWKPGKNAHTDWDGAARVKLQTMEFTMKPRFYESAWVQFHTATMRQRHLVLEHLL